MKVWQIGVMDSSYPNDIRWTDDYVRAETASDAEDLAGEKGYYRNLRVREAT